MTIYLIGALVTFVLAMLAFKFENKKITLGMLLATIALSLTSWFGFCCVFLAGCVMLHFKAQEEGWYDIELF